MKLAILQVGSRNEPQHILAVGRGETHENPDQAPKSDASQIGFQAASVDAVPDYLREFARLLEVARQESARGIVLVYATMLDEQLKRAIEAFLVDHADVLKLTEGFNAPVGTFSARMLLAFGLGLVSHTEYKELVLIRKIRNEFAHSMDMTFDHQSVSSRCKLLSGAIPDYPAPRDQFNAAAASLVLNLLNRAHYVSKKRLSHQGWQI
jgi:DNA-binding MltR family transcriptional regulator